MSALIWLFLGLIALGLAGSGRTEERKPLARHRSPDGQTAEDVPPSGYLDEGGSASADPPNETTS